MDELYKLYSNFFNQNSLDSDSIRFAFVLQSKIFPENQNEVFNYILLVSFAFMLREL